MKIINRTPRQDGFFMPAEAMPHRRTLMVWPERTDNWRLGAKPAQQAFTQIASAIAEFEPVTMFVSAAQYQNARRLLPNTVRVIELSTNDAWARDIGPTFVKHHQSGELRGIDWRFNAWGGLTDGLYFPWDKDDQAAGKICEVEAVDYYRLKDFVLEGGSIHVDGDGTALVTEACLLSQGRNPQLTKAEIEQRLKEYLNVDCVIWLPRGIYLDETNEHIDNVCAFVRPGEVVLAWTEDKSDPQYQLSLASYQTLCRAIDAKGRQLTIHKLPLPQPIYISAAESEGVDIMPDCLPRRAGDRLAASYVNYYVCNGAVIMPGFGDAMDKEAKAILAQLYPDRRIVQLNTREILLGGGNIHCITQQVPK